MKFLAFILSVYIFGLNLAPCEDNDVYDNEVKTEISKSSSDDHEHQDSDLCSPFCSCQCCHINTIWFKIPDLKLHDVIIVTREDIHYKDDFENNFSISVFQPPKV